MNTKSTHLRIRFVWVTCLVGLLLLPSWSVAVSEDLKEIIKQNYQQKPDYQTANNKLSDVLKDNRRTPDDRQFILIYLTLIALVNKETEQTDNYLCQLLSVQPGFDPEFSTSDITDSFKEAFNRLKTQNLCLPLNSYEPEVKKALVEKNCDRVEQLLVKWEILLPESSPELGNVKKWREDIQSSKILGQCSSNEPSPEQLPPRPLTSCGVIRFRVEKLVTQNCQPLLTAKRYIATGPTKTVEGTALECYQQAQKLCPDDPNVRKGFEDMETFYVEKIKQALSAKQFDKAKSLLDNLKAVNPQSPSIKDFESKLP
ncbi:MAG: hypothetical protein BWK78_00990 [Thiotrichaceae bacterium IS1]|nr:MAG: hypothetical protein BWK78_00990 [Thiotrichaceae bacterium IS1]